MSWVIAALLATTIMAIVNFGDKLVSARYIPNAYAIQIFFGFVNLSFGVLFWIYNDFAILAVEQMLPLILAGMVTVAGGYFYFQAVMQEEMSRLIVLGQLVPVYTLIMGVIFLGERPSAVQLIGFVLILVAAVGVSVDPRKAADDAILPTRGAALRLLMIATFMWSIAFIFTDLSVDAWVVDMPTLLLSLAYNNFGYWLATMLLLLLPHVRRPFLEHLRGMRAEGFIAINVVEGLFAVRQILLFQALLLGQAGLVAIVSSMNVFIGIFLGWALSLFWPQIFKEDTRRDSLFRKLAWAGVAFVGILFVR